MVIDVDRECANCGLVFDEERELLVYKEQLVCEMCVNFLGSLE